MAYTTSIPYCTDAAAYYAAIADLPWAIWLDSGGRGHYDILCAQPLTTLLTRGATTVISQAAGTQHSTDNPLDLLRQQLGAPLPALPAVPFAGGALGYWGYDLARRWVTLPAQAQDAEQLPDMAIGIYDWAIVLDHQQQTAQLVSHLRAPTTAQVLPQILARLHGSSQARGPEFTVQGGITSNLPRAAYQSAFDTVQHYLREGDCYQVNLAQRYAAHASGDAFSAYLELRRLSPAPYAAFLNLPQAQILCASPECFLHVHNGQVQTMPIKGTRLRLADPQQDAQTIYDLQHSAKDRAENLMIVDLLRNDLGKSCAPGSVQTPRLFEIESFAQVHHLVSTITGQLAAGQDALALLRNCFPGGSVTGAPKQRAMEIIEQLEPHRRGVYCGSIGYAGFDGNMDSNIAIRTLVYANGEIRFWAGGGVVADSEEEGEYQETLDKAGAMVELLRRFGGVGHL